LLCNTLIYKRLTMLSKIPEVLYPIFAPETGVHHTDPKTLMSLESKVSHKNKVSRKCRTTQRLIQQSFKTLVSTE